MYYIDAKSLNEFKRRRDQKNNLVKIRNLTNHADHHATCAKHSYLECIPKVLTRNGYKCAVCDNY